MKYLSYAFGGLSAAGAGGYFAVYLYRWEWQRALIAGVVLLVVEMLLVCTALLGRIARLERRVEAAIGPRTAVPPPVDPRPAAAFPAAPGPAEERADGVGRWPAAGRAAPGGPPAFAWLERGDGGAANRTFVFVPVLLATGALLSAAAWVVQRVASAVAAPADARLAGRLAVLAAPPGGIREASPDQELSPVLRRPPGRRGRSPLLVGGSLLALAVLVLGLAELTQTRREERPRAAATTFVLKASVRGDDTEAGRDLLAERLWGSCRASTSVLLLNAPLSRVEDGVYAGVVRPALTPHDLMRLRGCLVDSKVDRVRFEILGEGQIESRG